MLASGVKTAVAAFALLVAIALAPGVARADLSEDFDPVAAAGQPFVPSGWSGTNLSSPTGGSSWFQGSPPAGGPFTAHQGADTAYIAANFNSTTGGTGTISNWLITPQLTLSDGDEVSFYTRTTGDTPTYPDRLELRLSASGSCSPGSTATGVGDFSTLLLSVNPALTTSGYPSTWTRFSAVLGGLSAPIRSCIAFRYFITEAGPTGTNGDYVGIDTFRFVDDVTAPDAPAVDAVAPASPSNVAAPRAIGTADAGSTVTLYGDGSCSGPVLGSGSAAAFAADGIAFTAATDATTTPYATATDGSLNVSPCSTAGPSYRHDGIAPETADDLPSGWLTAAPAVALTAIDAGSGVAATYYTVGAAPAPPTTASTLYDPAAKPVLGDGERIRYFSVDAAGNPETPHSSLTVIAPPEPRPEPRLEPEPRQEPDPPTPRTPSTPIPDAPAVTVTDRPGELLRGRAVRIVFLTDPAAAGYECRLDGGEWTPCGPTTFELSGLRGGDHRVEVRAVTAGGRRGPATVHTFQVNPYSPGLALAGSSLQATGDGTVALSLGCSPREGEGRGRCLGTVRLTHAVRAPGGRGRRVHSLARASFAAGAGERAAVRLRLTTAGRRLLAGAPGRRLSVRVVVEAVDLAGNRTLVSFARTLDRAR
jgi:hypothetical protein